MVKKNKTGKEENKEPIFVFVWRSCIVLIESCLHKNIIWDKLDQSCEFPIELKNKRAIKKNTM